MESKLLDKHGKPLGKVIVTGIGGEVPDQFATMFFKPYGFKFVEFQDTWTDKEGKVIMTKQHFKPAKK